MNEQELRVKIAEINGWKQITQIIDQDGFAPTSTDWFGIKNVLSGSFESIPKLTLDEVAKAEKPLYGKYLKFIEPPEIVEKEDKDKHPNMKWVVSWGYYPVNENDMETAITSDCIHDDEEIARATAVIEVYEKLEL